MFDEHRAQQFEQYNKVREYFVKKPDVLIGLEHFFTDYLKGLVAKHWASIESDYNEASYLYPFWQNYPPDDRGRQPKGDQFPWIEVGEHAVGEKLPRLLSQDFKVRDSGIPTGADQRFVLSSKKIEELTKGLTNSAWLSVDIKSVGPRDDADHIVMSHNQVSGDGIWAKPGDGVKNAVMKARGERTSHDFHCSIPPLYVLSDMTIAPVVNIALKPVYSMLALETDGKKEGQPLSRITVACIPNGILLKINPGYLKKYPGLLFPGKDDKGMNPLKVRARVSFSLLQKVDKWRVSDVKGSASSK